MHCWAILATESRSIPNFGSPTAEIMSRGIRYANGFITLTTRHQDGFELTMNDDIGVATNGASEVRIQRGVQSVMAVLRDIKHASAEVLRTEHRFCGQYLDDFMNVRIDDCVEATLKGGGGRNFQLYPHSLGRSCNATCIRNL